MTQSQPMPTLYFNSAEYYATKTRPKKKPKKRAQTSMIPSFIVTGILSCTLVGFLTFVTVKEPTRVHKRRVVSSVPIPGSVGKRQQKKTQQATMETITIAEARIRLTNALRKDILNLAPGVYAGVKLIFLDEVASSGRGEAVLNGVASSGRKGAASNLDQKIQYGSGTSGRVRTDSRSAEKLKIEYVEISVAAQPWNKMRSNRKIGLLYKTFNMLQTHYPGLSQYIRVTFDDNRQALDLKFDTFKREIRNS